MGDKKSPVIVRRGSSMFAQRDNPYCKSLIKAITITTIKQCNCIQI